MTTTHLWREETVEVDDSVIVGVTIEPTTQERKRLWYRIPIEYAALLTPSCDPFVVATVLMAMNQSTNVVVHGQVSPSLLQNLAEFQIAWACWRPREYRQVEITAEVEQEQPNAKLEGQAIAAFSGGVDSCFTMFRHRTGRCGKVQRHITAGLMVHGFDIPLEQKQVFDHAAQKSQVILDSLGVEFIPMASNYREIICLNWEDAYGTAIASCLMLFQKRYPIGLLGSAFPYQNLMLPRGSNPVTDQFLSNKSFQLVHDGAGFTRLEKIKEIVNWSAALDNLRVCWQGSQLDRNCGRCEKCIRTILGFRLIGCSLPASFQQDVTDDQILNLKGVRAMQLAELDLILAAAKAAAISDSWVRALETCIKNNQRQLALKKFFKDQLPAPLQQQVQKMRSRFFKLRSYTNLNKVKI